MLDPLIRISLVAAGLVVSVPTLLFFWVGSRTFIRARERWLAVAMAAGAGLLLVLSIGLIFDASVQRVQLILLVAFFGTNALLFGVARRGRSRLADPGPE